MSSPTPLVAIRCITYNHAPYIRQCLDGFVMQRTDFAFVAIVHDDCSTDGTDVIVREYAQRYPHIIKPIFETENQYSKGDGSLSRIMTQACNKTGAKYIALCEGDDYWTDPLKLQKQVDFLENHPECSCCVHDYLVWIQSENQFLHYDKIRYLKDFKGNGLTKDLDDYSELVFFTKTLTAVYRNKCLLDSKYKHYIPKFDMTMFFALATQGDIYLMNERMGVYRVNNGGVFSGPRRDRFLDATNPYMYTLCKVERTEQSKKFVYHYIKRYVVPLFLNPCKNNLFLTFYYLGPKWGSKLLYSFIIESTNIIKHKFKG